VRSRSTLQTDAYIQGYGEQVNILRSDQLPRRESALHTPQHNTQAIFTNLLLVFGVLTEHNRKPTGHEILVGNKDYDIYHSISIKRIKRE
jgi:hypothetical protein